MTRDDSCVPVYLSLSHMESGATKLSLHRGLRLFSSFHMDWGATASLVCGELAASALFHAWNWVQPLSLCTWGFYKAKGCNFNLFCLLTMHYRYLFAVYRTLLCFWPKAWTWCMVPFSAWDAFPFFAVGLGISHILKGSWMMILSQWLCVSKALSDIGFPYKW